MKREDSPHSQATLRQQLKVLIKNRKLNIDAISKLQKKKQLLTNHQPYDRIENLPTKKVKYDPSTIKQQQAEHSNKVCNQNQQGQNKDATHGGPIKLRQKSKSKQSITPQTNKLKSQYMQRSRRMLGTLNSYLRQAKTTIEAQQPKAEQKNRIIEQAREKEREQNQELIRNQTNKIQNELRILQEDKQKNAEQILQIENTLLLGNYTNYTNNLKSFIFTKTEPPLAWLPAKEFDMAKKLLGEKQKQIQTENKLIVESIQKYEQKFDYNIYLINNQKQYYAKMIKKYYDNTGAYHLTQTQPKILWKPSKPINKGKKQLGDVQFTQNQIQEVGTKTDLHYDSIIRKLQQRKSVTNIRDRIHKNQESEDSHSPYNFIKEDESDE